jgi:hypothetical protein
VWYGCKSRDSCNICEYALQLLLQVATARPHPDFVQMPGLVEIGGRSTTDVQGYLGTRAALVELRLGLAPFLNKDVGKYVRSVSCYLAFGP